MKITHIKKHSEEELMEKLRKVGLYKNPEIFVYEKADITFPTMALADVQPVQLYALTPVVETIKDLHNELSSHGVDIFQLNGYITYHTSDGLDYTLIPPIVEYQTNQKGEIVPVLLDGIHRGIYARQVRLPSLQVVAVKNANPNYPIVGYPNNWEDIEFVESAPSAEKKRIWRVAVADGYSLYRDFNTAFSSVGKPREASQ